MAEVGEIRARLVLSNEEFKRKMNETREDLKRTSFSAEQLGKDFGAVQKASLAVGGAVVAAIGGSVKVAADFEQSMAKVKAISGATDEEFVRLEKSAREMGASTIFSASEAAEGLTYLAMAGFDVDQQIGSLPAVLNAAIAGNMSLGDSANIVTNIMSAFGLEAEESGRAVDVLAKAANTANTDIPLMGEAFKMVAPVAESLGWSIEETAAAIGELGNVGIAGSQAGTVLRASLLALANPTGQTEKAMKRLNIEAIDANGNMKSLPDLIGHVSERMKGMTDAQKTQTAAQLVGREAAAGFLALLDVGEDSLKNYVTELENSAGAAQKMADIQGATLIGAFKEFQSAIEEVGIKLGNEFLPMFREIVLWGADVVSSFDDINLSQAKSVLAFAGTAAAIGLTISSVGKLVLAVRGLMASMGPAGWLILGLSVVGGLIAANNVNQEKAVDVNLDHARSLDEQSKALDHQITRYEALREKNKLTNDELAEFVDLQSRIALETDTQKIEELQNRYDKLLEKSGLTNEEMAEFLGLNDEIVEKVPNSNLILSEQGHILLENTDAAKSYNEQLQKELELELRKQATIASSNLEENIRKHTEALQEQNSLAQDYLNKQQEIEVQKMRVATEEEKYNIAIASGDQGRISAAEERLSKEQLTLKHLEKEGYELAGQVITQEEIINNIELEIKKGQEAYQELIKYRLEQVDVVAEKGKEIEAIDKAIGKTEDLRKKAVEKYTVDGKITAEGQEQIGKIDEQIVRLNNAKSEVQNLKQEQDKLTGSIDDSVGVAEDLTYEMSKDVKKHLEQTGYKIDDARKLTLELEKPVTKRVSVWERVTRFLSGGNETKHGGGIVGDGRSTGVSSLPKLHSGGVPELTLNRFRDLPLHNEIDVRLLQNEMVLTEGQQSNLFNFIRTRQSDNLNGNTVMDERVIELLASIDRALAMGLNATLVFDKYDAADELEPLITEKQEFNENRYSEFRGGA